ncbi:odorant receptor 67a-like [Leptopilina boulardi]|uniref:odorant receptor 67a-like n=1 Tax=Leptopilina boulardi TaxID=63433 RepID=UPI0021F51635|nr:odorant receptor 67a-like [Leptopilina boulardi]
MLSSILLTYIKYLKIFTSFCAFWPFLSYRESVALRILYAIFLISLVIPWVIHVYSVRNDIEGICDSLSLGLLIPLGIMNFIYIVKHEKVLQKILNHMSQDFYNVSENKQELKILKESSDLTRLFTIVYLSYTLSTTLSYLVVTCTPLVLNKIKPLNVSRSIPILIELDYYFFDKKDYFFWTTVHLYITGSYGVFTVICCDLLLFAFAQHACGMFKVLRYKLKVIMNHEDTPELSLTTSEMYKKACSCVITHNRILELVNDVNEVFSFCLLFSFGVVILLVAIHGSVVILKLHDVRFVLKECITGFGQVFHLFLLCFVGELVNNHSSNLNNYIYDFEWVDSSPEIKKLICIMLNRSYSNCSLCVGKTFVLSFDFFTTIMKTIFSYLNVLNSQR